jgi:hypothetical protein
MIVEGHGEVAAAPLLVRRIAESIAPSLHIEVLRPIRVKRQRLLTPNELERAVELAGRQIGSGGNLIILLDAEDDCPKQLGPEILQRAARSRPDCRIRVVLAKTEYESWLVAAADSIAGRRGVDPSTTAPADPESIRDAKGWLTKRMPSGRSYRETLDQPALTAIIDLSAARSASPSFAKFWRDLESLL